LSHDATSEAGLSPGLGSPSFTDSPSALPTGRSGVVAPPPPVVPASPPAHLEALRPYRTLEQSLVLAADVAALALLMTALRAFSPPALAYLAIALFVVWWRGGYRVPVTLRALDEVPHLFGLLALPLFVILPLAATTPLPQPFVLFIAGAPVALGGARCLAYLTVRTLRRQRRIGKRVLILGSGVVARDIARILLDHPEYGMWPMGRLDDEANTFPVPYLGRPDDLHEVLAREKVERVVVAFSRTGEHELVEILRTAVSAGVEVYIVPRFFDIGQNESVDRDDIWGIPLHRVRPPGPAIRGWRMKRAFDLAAASIGVFILLPALVCVAAGVKLSSPGPVLFRQRRVGLNGQHFDMLKFRSMRENDDSDTRWNVADDPRRTAFGRFLRRTTLDELPQLLNVVRGDMSLVGPRPERPHFVAQFGANIPHYASRLRVPPGVTGHAQVHGLRGDTSIEERARFDNFYIERWSLWRDIAILGRTAVAVLRGESPTV
jgi:exopolysaccharide biosynthesis polyprenyl glycosylphosphotransferase